MDTNTKERELINGAIAAAQALGADLKVAKWQPRVGDKRADALINLQVGEKRTQYHVEAKKGLRPATLGAVLLQLHELEQLGNPVMLVTDYVTPQLAETLRESGMPFIDAAGNAFINQPPLLVWVKGERPVEKPFNKLGQGRGFQGAGLRVVFALLCQPDWVNLPYRKLADLAGVAHGTVGWVMKDLGMMGFIIKLQRQRRLRNRRLLLNMWVEAYARVLRPQLLLGRYGAPARDWWREVKVQEFALQLGAEPAAATLDTYLVPGVTTFYGEKIPGRFIAENQLRTEPKGDVELRKRFWNFAYEWDWPELVPPVLIYADLLALGDARCVEAAKRIYEAHLARLYEQD